MSTTISQMDTIVKYCNRSIIVCCILYLHSLFNFLVVPDAEVLFEDHISYAFDNQSTRLVEEANTAQILCSVDLYSRNGLRVKHCDYEKMNGSLVEASFIGRAGRDLNQNIDLILKSIHVVELV